MSEDHRRKKIDFSKLSEKELKDLSSKWESEAMKVEGNYDYKLKNKFPVDRIESAHTIANKLWRRLRTLERWRAKYGKQQRAC